MLSLKVPPLGESIVEATVSRWLKREGDSVNAGETVVELDTDKITVEVPALRPGVLVKRVVSEGGVVKVGDELGEIDEAAVAAGAGASGTTGGTAGGGRGSTEGSGSAPEGERLGSTSAAPPPQPPAAAPPSGREIEKSSPAARRLADVRGNYITAIQGTGGGGVVSKPDVIGRQGWGLGTGRRSVCRLNPHSRRRSRQSAEAPASSRSPVPDPRSRGVRTLLFLKGHERRGSG